MKSYSKHLATAIVLFSLLSCNEKKKEAEKVEVEPVVEEATKPKTIELLVGTYTDKESKGLYKLLFNPADGSLSEKMLVAETISPSYFDISKDRQFIYTVNESKPGNVSSYKWNEERTQLTLVSTQSSEGDHPCYAELNGDENLLAVGNYSSGNLVVYKVDENGVISPDPQNKQHEGSGPVKPNQDSAHAHCSKFDANGKFVYVADLGIDEIVAYPVGENGVLGEKQTALAFDKGDGPRHLIFHPTKDIAFIINELSGSIVSAKVNHETGIFERIDKQSTLPADFTGENSCADIHITSNGKFLYGSNRGHNSIAMFSVTEEGKLTLLGNEPVQGGWPRNFVISPDEKHLLVANKDTNNITVFNINSETGLLTYTGNQAEVSRPICLKF